MNISTYRLLIFVLCVSTTALYGIEINAHVDVKNQPNGYVILVTNDETLPIYVVLDFPKLEGFQEFSEPLPIVKKVFPLSSIEAIQLIKTNQDYSSYEIEYNFLFADPRNIKNDQKLLLLPFPHGDKHLLIQGWHGDKDHVGDRKYSVDFMMNVGDPISAVRDGTVVQVQNSIEGEGIDEDTNEKINFVLIKHKDNTFANYVRFKYKGIKVTQASVVKAGDILGYAGSRDEKQDTILHFELTIPTILGKMISIPFKFRSQDGSALEIIENKYYYSYIPGHIRQDNAETIKSNTDLTDYVKSLEANFEKNIIKIKHNNIGNEVIVYIANGFENTVIAEVNLTFFNLILEDQLPIIKKILPRSEIFLTKLSIIDEDEEYSLSSNIQYSFEEQ